MSTIRVVPNAVRITTIRGCASVTCPMICAAHPSSWLRSAPRARSAASAATIATSLPSLATYSGSSPSISHAPRTSSRTGIEVSSSSIPTRELPAISFSVLESPPRVGSRRQRTCWVASSSVPTSSCSAAESLRTSVSNFNPSRSARMAMPWSPTIPLTIIASPGRAWLADSEIPSRTNPIPVVLMYSPSALPFSTTFVSPVTICTPALSAAACIDATTRRNTSNGKPSSRMNATLIHSGRAAPIARSLIVPCTARDPMSPPLKNSGFTTNESVVIASRIPFSETTAWSSMRSSTGFPSAGKNTSCNNSALSFPPLPWPSNTRRPAGSGNGHENPTGAFGDSCFMLLEGNEMTLVLVIRCTGTFRRNHRRAEGLFRRTPRTERPAIHGLFVAEQHFRADALARLFSAHIAQPEYALRIKHRVVPLQSQSARANFPYATPLAVRHFKHALHGRLRRAIPSVLYRARIGVLHFRAPFFQLAHQQPDRLQQIHRFESAHYYGHAKFACQLFVFAHAHHRAHMPRRDESLHAVAR